MSARVIDPGRKILRYPLRLADMRAGRVVWPLHVEFDLTNRCNAACRTCDFRHVHDGSLMPTALACSILAQLRDAGVEAVTFTGGGEPTIHPDFADITRVAASLGLSLGLYTNLLDVRGLREVVECFAWVYASVDACDAESYLAAKGVEGWGRVSVNLREIMGRRLPDRTTVGMGYLMTDANWAKAGLVLTRATDFGVDYVQFRPTVGLAAYGWVYEALAYLRQLASGYSPLPILYTPDRFLDMLSFTRSYSTCRGSALVPCVGADGTLWACTNTRGLRPLGSLVAESFRDLWLRRPAQTVGDDCRVACRNHALNETLEYVCGGGRHAAFV